MFLKCMLWLVCLVYFFSFMTPWLLQLPQAWLGSDQFTEAGSYHAHRSSVWRQPGRYCKVKRIRSFRRGEMQDRPRMLCPWNCRTWTRRAPVEQRKGWYHGDLGTIGLSSKVKQNTQARRKLQYKLGRGY